MCMLVRVKRFAATVTERDHACVKGFQHDMREVVSIIAGGIESGEVVKGCNTQRVPHRVWKLQRCSAVE